MPKKKRDSKKEEPKKEEVSEKIPKKQEESENRILKIVLVIVGILIIFVVAYFIFSGGQTKFDYKGIQFQTEKMGNLTFYDTMTLATSATTGQPFGFRIRTNPNDLKNVPFENVDNFTLMKVNGYVATNHTFSCDGYGVIAMANLEREFSEMGMQFIRDQNATCDPAGRYNFFMIDYGNKTQIRQIGNRCYEIEIKGNDSNCEILPATEKLMVEMYAKYLNLSSGK